jgi:hypothetical protein
LPKPRQRAAGDPQPAENAGERCEAGCWCDKSHWKARTSTSHRPASKSFFRGILTWERRRPACRVPCYFRWKGGIAKSAILNTNDILPISPELVMGTSKKRKFEQKVTKETKKRQNEVEFKGGLKIIFNRE